MRSQLTGLARPPAPCRAIPTPAKLVGYLNSVLSGLAGLTVMNGFLKEEEYPHA